MSTQAAEAAEYDPHAPQPVVIEQAPTELKLDLACGNTPREGFSGVDLYADKAERVDLMRFPWPWADSSVDEAHCSHFVEHLPMVYVTETGDYSPMPAPGAVDLFMRFFAEVWRVLKPGAQIYVVTPSLRSSRAFQDPSHRRFLAGESYLYLSADWRKMNGLDHYVIPGHGCNFGVEVFPTIAPNMGLEARSAEVQGYKVQHEWNTTSDFHARLKAIK